VQVFSGSLGDAVSPAEHFSELVGADLTVHRGETLTVPIRSDHEHAALVLDGAAELDGHAIEPGLLYYLGTQRDELAIRTRDGARALVIGGRPFGDTILMWWNFVARTPDEIRHARDDWEAHRRFGEVRAYQGPRLAAPELVRLAHPNPVS
jgi:redox-sensitive bicupin YhaK (pirin superfamily)